MEGNGNDSIVQFLLEAFSLLGVDLGQQISNTTQGVSCLAYDSALSHNSDD